MPRPQCCRRIGFTPGTVLFKPVGIPMPLLETVVLTLDEVEALRLADALGLYQEQAAERMGISHPTFSRIVGRARRKIADALVNGKAMRLEGGVVALQHGDVETCGHASPCGCGKHRQGRCDTNTTANTKRFANTGTSQLNEEPS